MTEDSSLLHQLDVLAMPSRLDPSIHFLRYVALLRTLSHHIQHLQSQVQLAPLNSIAASVNLSTSRLASNSVPSPPVFTPIRLTPSQQKGILDTSMLLMLRFCRVVFLQLPKHPTFRHRFHTAALSALVVEAQLFQSQIHNYCKTGSQAFFVAFISSCADHGKTRPPIITISSPTDQGIPLNQTITDPSLLSANTSAATLTVVVDSQKQRVVSASSPSKGTRDRASSTSQSTILPSSTRLPPAFLDELALLSKICPLPTITPKRSSVSGDTKQSGVREGKLPLGCSIALSQSGCAGKKEGVSSKSPLPTIEVAGGIQKEDFTQERQGRTMTKTRSCLTPKAQAFNTGASSTGIIEDAGTTVQAPGLISIMSSNPVSKSSSICSDDNKDSALQPHPLAMSRTTIKSWLSDIPDVGPTKSRAMAQSQHEGDAESMANPLQATISVKPYIKVADSFYRHTYNSQVISAIDDDSSDSDGTLQYLEVDSPGSTQRRNVWEDVRYNDSEAINQGADMNNGEKTANSKVDMETNRSRGIGIAYTDLEDHKGITTEEERSGTAVNGGNAMNTSRVLSEKAEGLERNHSQNSTDSTRSTKTVHCDEGASAAVPFVVFAKTALTLRAAMADPRPDESYSPEPAFKRSYVAETHFRGFSSRSCSGSVGSNSSDRSLVSSTSRSSSWSCKPGLGIWTKQHPGMDEREQEGEKSTRTLSPKSTRSTSSLHADCTVTSEVRGRVLVDRASATFTPQPSASPIGAGGRGPLGATVEERRRRFMQPSDAESASGSASGTAIRPRSRSGSGVGATALSTGAIAAASSTAAKVGMAGVRRSR